MCLCHSLCYNFRMHCAKCKAYTEKTELLNVEVDVCPECRGLWFDRNELSTIVGTKQDLKVRPMESRVQPGK